MILLIGAVGPVFGMVISLAVYALLRVICWLVLLRVGDPNEVYVMERRPIR